MSGRRSVMARITALTAPIVTTLAMSRLTAATVVCVSAAVWGASTAYAQSAGAEAYGEVSTAVSQSFQRLIAAVVKVLPAAISAVIVLGDTEGTVEQIEFRATYIRTYDGRLVLVPNGEVFTSRITNNTASPLRRLRSADARCPGLPGVAAQPECEEPCRRHRRHVIDAGPLAPR